MPARQRSEEPVVYSVTTAASRADDDSSQRIRRYLITMSIRTLCFILMIVFHGWLRWTFLAGAAFLPYFAVVAANARAPRIPGEMQTPLSPPDDTKHLRG